MEGLFDPRPETPATAKRRSKKAERLAAPEISTRGRQANLDPEIQAIQTLAIFGMLAQTTIDEFNFALKSSISDASRDELEAWKDKLNGGQ